MNRLNDPILNYENNNMVIHTVFAKGHLHLMNETYDYNIICINYYYIIVQGIFL